MSLESVGSESDWAQQSHLARILGVTATFLVFSLAFVSARVYTRVFIIKSAGLDDVIMVFATV